MPARVQPEEQRMADDEQTQHQAQEKGQEQDAEQMELDEQEERDGQMFDMDQQRITLVCAASQEISSWCDQWVSSGL